MDPLAQLHQAVRTVPDFPKPGIQFKDITPLLSQGPMLTQAVDLLVAPFEGQDITQVIGIESRGFILGSMLADRLGCGFVPVRKHGKLPYDTFQATYDLEYGTDTVEVHTDALHAGDRVLIHDDVIATGGTAAATAKLVEHAQATLVGFAFLIELNFLNGRSRLDPTYPIHTVLQY